LLRLQVLMSTQSALIAPANARTAPTVPPTTWREVAASKIVTVSAGVGGVLMVAGHLVVVAVGKYTVSHDQILLLTQTQCVVA
jgi:hypothetical protein